MNPDILKKASEWAQNDYFDFKDRQEIQCLIDEKQEKELTERFYQDIEFGTGGLRSILGVGSNRMNKYNVRRATQALCQIIKKTFESNLSVVVSYDCRINSDLFAREIASVFAGNNIKTYLFDQLTPVPLVSFAIRDLKCHGGVMVTASHNPREYNGYKAFWADGYQVVPPYDQEIILAYQNINDWNAIQYCDFDKAQQSGLIEYVPQKTWQNYYQALINLSVHPQMIKEQGDQLKIIYTPIHGTGLKPVEEICQRLGFKNFQVVAAQAKPDGKFPTVEFPNPEFPEALQLAVEQMKLQQGDIVMGSDPDTDRLGVAVIDHDQVVFLNGNQIGVLMLDYLLSQLSEKNQLPKHPLVIKSIMTTELQTKIAHNYHTTVMNTLTGFKWMGSLYTQLEKAKSPLELVFASEESYGYMPHKHVRDKDGVASVSLFAELTLFHKLRGKNIIEALSEIYERYGYFQESLLQFTFQGIEGQEKIQKIMTYFREQMPKSFCGENIQSILDISKGTRIDLTKQTVETIDLPKSNVLGFTFESGNILYLRPSGTEPKIKFYSLIQVHKGNLALKKKIAQEIISTWESEVKKICKAI